MTRTTQRTDSVQNRAADRNTRAEQLFEFVLETAFISLRNRGVVTDFGPHEPQKSFQAEEASDVFDHFVAVTRTDGSTLEVWGQTTCYKGSASGNSEPNKTYEVRETLVEALSLRAAKARSNCDARIVHFTIGDPAYTYGWIKAMKDVTFDLSLYLPPDTDHDAIYEELEHILNGAVTRQDRFESFHRAETAGTPLGCAIANLRRQVEAYFTAGALRHPYADAQATLLRDLTIARSAQTDRAVEDARRGGLGIKQRVIAVLADPSSTTDPLIRDTAVKLLSGKPFVAEALIAVGDWASWSTDALAIPTTTASLEDYVMQLWQSDRPKRHVVRRLLLRAHNFDSEDAYIQDLDVTGINERNLYPGEHTVGQVTQLVTKISARLRSAGIVRPTELQRALRSPQAFAALKKSAKREAGNGASLRPSFDYLQLALADEYDAVDFVSAGIVRPIGYQSSFADNVGAYENMRVLVRKSDGRAVAIVKGKFFSKAEGPRRAKEEAYVGLTARYELRNSQFVERYVRLPLVMFADMPEGHVLPAFAVRRLSHFGWDVFFDVDTLRRFLRAQPGHPTNG